MSVTFEKLQEINYLINKGQEDRARNEIIKVLSYADKPYPPVLNHLIREVGLYPYLNFDEFATWEDKLIYEIFKVDIGEEKNVTLHREQSDVLKQLLDGENIALSAPTSFGKSFIIDALIAMKHPNTVVILLPTIALMDEARRRLTRKFAATYKIITTPNETIEEKTILIFPQERSFGYENILKKIDLFIVDEFYKVSKDFDAERSDILLKAIMKFTRIAAQRYFLNPNITNIKNFENSAFTNNMKFISKLSFNTVITNVIESYRDINDTITKEAKFKEIINKIGGKKTLIYAGTFSAIHEVCELLIHESTETNNNSTLESFSLWLEKNYTADYRLKDLVMKGIGVHNGRLHRFLSQIQTHLFNKDGLSYIVSTSSLIEGVNTSAENVIMWKHKNGNRNLRPLDYKNLLGRSGRMFKHFIGNVYLLESPIDNTSVQLELQFSDNVQGDINISEYSDFLSEQNKNKIKAMQQNLGSIIGEREFSSLIKNNMFKSSNWQLLLNIATDMKTNPTKWKFLKCLNSENADLWKDAIKKVLFFSRIFPNNIDYNTFADFIVLLSNNWTNPLSIQLVNMKSRGIDIEQYFDFERKASFNFSSLINDINILQKAIIPQISCDLSSFVTRLSYSFLPPNVYYLEEYGLPRMISQKICSAGIIPLDDSDKSLGDVIKDFLAIGESSLLQGICNSIDDFDKYIISFFYRGLGV